MRLDMDMDMRLARICDVLEQIENLNQQIGFHQKNNGDASSIAQYEYMAEEFIGELKDLMKVLGQYYLGFLTKAQRTQR